MDPNNNENLIAKNENDEKANKILSLKVEFDKYSENIGNFINNKLYTNNAQENKENKKYLLILRDILMIKNVDQNKNFEFYIIFSIIHFYALSEINGILFSLLEEIKKSSHYLFKKDSEYNKNKNFYNFFLDLVLYDSSQINFNYLSSIFSNAIINLIDVIPTYIISTACNAALIILLYLFHLSELTDEHENEVIYFFQMVSFFILIYFFTGIIGLLPFYLLENKNNSKNIVVGNLCLFLGVIIKNFLHLLFKYIIDNNNPHKNIIIYWIKALLFLLCSIGYIIFLCLKKPKKKYDEIYQYSIGELSIIKKFSTITLKIQKFWEYISSFLSTPSVIYLLILNLTSRTQKIVFKSKYKALYVECEGCDKGWLLMIISFFDSFLLYLIIMIYYIYCREKNVQLKNKIEEAKPLEEEEKKEEEEEEIKEKIKKDNEENNSINNIENNSIKKRKKKKLKEEETERNLTINDIKENLNKIEEQKIKNKNFEEYIFKLILIEHFLSLCLSIFFWIFDCEPLILILITISGAINFVYNDFYANKTVQYLSLSGFMSINQIFLRILEMLYSVYKSDYWIILQIGTSCLGIVFVYFNKCQLIEKTFPCLIITYIIYMVALICVITIYIVYLFRN